MTQLVFVQANARGLPMGDSHPRTRWPRETVDRALAMRAAGRMYREIRHELGVAHSTLHSWFTGRRRRPPDRVIVKRVKERDSFVTNRQRAMTANDVNTRTSNVSTGIAERVSAADAVTSTVKGDK